jgi:hypothetical protein
MAGVEIHQRNDMKKLIAISAVGLTLAACTGTGTAQGDRALTGAAVGGAAGAVIGGIATGRGSGALAGAAIGAAGGAIVGAATTPREQCYWSDYYGRTICRPVN